MIQRIRDTSITTIDPIAGATTTVKGIAIDTANIATKLPGSITVTNPTAGLTYKIGEARVIRWQSAGSVGPNVKIELLKTNVAIKVISSSTANDGQMAWTVPTVQTGSDYQIRVTSTSSGQIFGISDNFTIIGTTPPIKYRCTGAPDYRCVEDPNGKYNSLKDCTDACKPAPVVHNLGIFYYPWFGGNSNVSPQDTWRHWKNGGHNPPKTWASNYLPDYKPSIFDPNDELYSSKDINVIKWQLSNMKSAGIEFVISSWWGQNSYEDQALSIIFSNVLHTVDNPYPDIRFCIYYEKEGIRDVPQSEIIADINYIKQKYASDPHYFKINGKPVVFVYNAIGNGASIAAKWKNVRNITGIYAVLKVFGGYTGIANYVDSWHQYAPTLPFEQQYGYSAFVSPGYYKYHEQPRLAREDFIRFENNVVQLKNANVQFRLIETWNEWEEATGIEPAQKINHNDTNGFTPATDSYGTKYLDILAKYFK